MVLHYTTTAGEQTMMLKKAPPSAAELASKLQPSGNDPSPKPGYSPCAGWCRVKVTGYKIITQPWGAGTFRPVLAITVRIHNATGGRQWLAHSYITGDNILRLLPAGEAQPDNKAWSTNATVGPMPTKVDYNNGSPGVLPGPTELPPGSEVSADYWITTVGAETDRLWIEFGRQLRGTIDAKEMSCAFFKRAAELDKEGILAGGDHPTVPDRCVSISSTTHDDAGGAENTSGESASSSPVGSAVGSPSGSGSSPAPGSAGRATWPTPSQPAPAEAADGFKPLLKYGVKLESVGDRGDGRFEVVALLKNRSAAPLYLTSGQIVVYAEDGDGVGQEQRQVWRARVEPPELFAATPVIQPGATLRARWLFRASPDNPLIKISFGEGAKRAEFSPGM
jgi:hypothetical protein